MEAVHCELPVDKFNAGSQSRELPQGRVQLDPTSMSRQDSIVRQIANLAPASTAILFAVENGL